MEVTHCRSQGIVIGWELGQRCKYTKFFVQAQPARIKVVGLAAGLQGEIG